MSIGGSRIRNDFENWEWFRSTQQLVCTFEDDEQKRPLTAPWKGREGFLLNFHLAFLDLRKNVYLRHACVCVCFHFILWGFFRFLWRHFSFYHNLILTNEGGNFKNAPKIWERRKMKQKCIFCINGIRLLACCSKRIDTLSHSHTHVTTTLLLSASSVQQSIVPQLLLLQLLTPIIELKIKMK